MMNFLKRLFGGKSAPQSEPPPHLPPAPKAQPSALDTGTPIETELPFDVRQFRGHTVIEALAALRTTQPGSHPFIMGDGEGALGTWLDAASFAPNAAETLKKAKDYTLETWRADKAEALKKLIEQYGDDIEQPEAMTGDWPEDGQPNEYFMAHISLQDYGPFNTVNVGFTPAPVERFWETFAYTGFGNWNDCPPPELHMTLAKQWHDQYGAVLVSHTTDILEYAIQRPIQTREEAMEMARLQYEYCSDIVDQGVGTLEALAANLLGATVWYFWWD